MRIAVAIALLGMLDVPPCAKLRTKGSISVNPDYIGQRVDTGDAVLRGDPRRQY